ncbi:tagaturonate epimerase family protein, partial [Akkermansiaceae bacterium]|nr:tagaturonate epimerase family protein [Akkermansiaceae bacterium]
GSDDFVTEVSMDETDKPQVPAEMLIILAAIADQGIPIQTIAPKFTGRFNKGVDYVGDVGQRISPKLQKSRYVGRLGSLHWLPFMLSVLQD